MRASDTDTGRRDSNESIYSIKAWSLRSAAVPWVPGSHDQIVSRLAALLDQIAKSPSIDERLTWPDGGGETSVRAAVRTMGRSSLIVRNPGGLLSVSDEGRSWLQNRDTSFLMAILHRN